MSNWEERQQSLMSAIVEMRASGCKVTIEWRDERIIETTQRATQCSIANLTVNDVPGFSATFFDEEEGEEGGVPLVEFMWRTDPPHPLLPFTEESATAAFDFASPGVANYCLASKAGIALIGATTTLPADILSPTLVADALGRLDLAREILLERWGGSGCH